MVGEDEAAADAVEPAAVDGREVREDFPVVLTG
jgi:hypothetical protein